MKQIEIIQCDLRYIRYHLCRSSLKIITFDWFSEELFLSPPVHQMSSDRRCMFTYIQHAQPESRNLEPASWNQEHASCNLHLKTCILNTATWTLNPGNCNLHPGTWSIPGTCILNHGSWILEYLQCSVLNISPWGTCVKGMITLPWLVIEMCVTICTLPYRDIQLYYGKNYLKKKVLPSERHML